MGTASPDELPPAPTDRAPQRSASSGGPRMIADHRQARFTVCVASDFDLAAIQDRRTRGGTRAIVAPLARVDVASE